MTGNDIAFAYGMAAVTWDETTRTVLVLDKRQAVMNLADPGSFCRQQWKDAGFELRAWDQAWKNNVDVLDQLMTMPDRSIITVSDMALRFQQDKAEVEAKLSDDYLHWTTDALLYDTTICNWMLQRNQRPSMMFYDMPAQPDADGCTIRFNWSDPIDLDSFIYGRLSGGVQSVWNTQVQPVKDALKKLANTYALHDHMPANDAVNIAVQATYANLPNGCDLTVLESLWQERQASLQCQTAAAVATE